MSNKIGYGYDPHPPCGDRRNKKFPDTCEKDEYFAYYWYQLYILLYSQFRISGIESATIDEGRVSRMLVDYGMLALYFDAIAKQLIALPCRIDALGINGKPRRVKVWSPWVSGYEFELDAAVDDFFVLYDNDAQISPSIAFFPFLDLLAELSVTIKVNTLVHRTPIVTLADKSTRLGVENILADYMRGVRVLEVKTNTKSPDQSLDNALKVLTLNAPYNIDKLEIQRRNVWNELLEKIGYKVNLNSSKKERQITDEVMGNLESTLGYYNNRKSPRERAVTWLNDHGINARLDEITHVSGMEEVIEIEQIHNQSNGVLSESVSS